MRRLGWSLYGIALWFGRGKSWIKQKWYGANRVRMLKQQYDGELTTIKHELDRMDHGDGRFYATPFEVAVECGKIARKSARMGNREYVERATQLARRALEMPVSALERKTQFGTRRGQPEPSHDH